MKTSNEYLDELKTALGVVSDYALAKKMGITTSSISNHRKHPHSFDAKTVFLVADLLGIDRCLVMLDALHQRATCEEEKAVYERLRRWQALPDEARWARLPGELSEPAPPCYKCG